MGTEDNDGWQGPISIDGNQYLHKSGVPQEGDLWYSPDRAPALRQWHGFSSSPPPRVLLKPVEPEPRFPTPDQFIDPSRIKWDKLVEQPLRNWPDVRVLRRQLESEERAVKLLRKWARICGPLTSQTRATLRARDEGLPWPEGA